MKNEQTDNQQNLARKVSQVLDEQVKHYDAATLSRLRQAREQALKAVDTRQSGFNLKMVGTVAAILVAIVLIHQLRPAVESTTPQTLETMETMMLFAEADIEFYEELDFYDWLEFDDAG